MDNIFGNIYGFIFVLLRITGFIMFNPILSRRNIPMTIKSALCMVLAYFYVSVTPMEIVAITGYFDFALIAAKEMLIGFVIGYIVNIFLSVLVLGGEIIDYQLGLTMGKMYDPTNGAQVSVTSALLNTMFVIFFFQSGIYISLIKIFGQSFQIVPIGFNIINPQSFMHIVGLFAYMYELAIKISIPIIAAHIITEMGVGILMKAVPQINVFVVNMQIKILVGAAVFFMILTPISNFINNSLSVMLENIMTALKLAV